MGEYEAKSAQSFIVVLDGTLAVLADLATLHDMGRLHGALVPEALRHDGDKVVGLMPSTGAGVPTLRGLQYASPEQAGRLEDKLSPRSDLYSLGILLYEWLAGEPPFLSDDPLELAHRQMTAPPPPLEDVPPALARIVAKLLAKSPAARYGSCTALEYDIRECRRILAETGEAPLFPLGTRDTAGGLLIPDKLYGRSPDIARLAGLHARAAAGETLLCLVVGYSGIGKTALVRSLRARVDGGFMLEGKHDQFRRQVPYSAIGGMLASLARRLMSGSAASINAWRLRLSEGLGEDAAVVVHAVPEMARLIGERPEPAPLTGAAAQHRFNHAFGRLFSCLGERDHPLVVFIDDMQWADLASLDLLQSLLAEQRVPYLLLICAYRENEMHAAHPFMRTLTEVRRKDIAVEEISVEPLAQADLEELVGDACPGLPERAGFCRKLMEKTGGNPFYVRQFLGELHAAGHLRFDPQMSHWEVAPGAVESLGRSENVVDLMTRRMRRLPPEALGALHAASCVGHRFSLETLALALGVKEEQALAMLAVGLHEEMVVPMGESAGREFAFVHDRVQQAAHALETEDRTRALRLSLARKLAATLPPAAAEKRIFELADHYNAAADLLEDSERLEVAALDLRAGSKARAAMAYRAAADYQLAGIALLPADAWEAQFKLAFDLHHQAAEALDLCGDAGFDRVCDLLEAHAADPLLRVRAHRLRITHRIHVGDLPGASEVGRQALGVLGIHLPPLDDTAALAREYDREIALFGDAIRARGAASLEHLPVSDDPVQEAVLGIISSIADSAILSNFPFFSLIVAVGVNRSIRHGNNRHSPLIYMLLAITLVVQSRRYREAKEIADAGLAMSQGPLGDIQSHSLTLDFYLWNTNHWAAPAETTLPLVELNYSLALRSHDLLYAGWSLVPPPWITWFMGRDMEEVRATVRRTSDYCDTHQYPFAKALVTPFAAAAEALGSPALPLGTLSPSFDEAAYLATWGESKVLMACLQIAKAHLLALAGDYSACLEVGEPALTNHLQSYVLHMSHRFWRGVCAARLASSATGDERREFLEALDAATAWFEPILREGCVGNVIDKVRFLEAERKRLDGDVASAAALAEEAAALAGENGFILNQGFFLESLGSWRAGSGDVAKARAAWDAARVAYLRCNATALAARVAGCLTSLSGARAGIGEFGLDTLDAIAVLKAAQAISGDMQQATLVPRLLGIMLEAGGAERAWIAMIEGDEILVEGAAGTLVPGDRVPERLVRYVANTREAVVLGVAEGYGEFSDDPVLVDRRPQAVLCMPLAWRQDTRRVLYLEHGEIAGVFSERRRQVLGWLVTQAAISMENAALYERSQQEVEERRRSENREVQRRRVLEQVAAGTPLSTILDTIVHLIEGESIGSLCSVLLLDREGKLLHGAAPSLPDFYNTSIHGLVIGDGVGSCGTAAFTGHRTVAEDIQTHPHWEHFRELAGRAGLRSAWSEPIRAADGRILGTFAIYHREVRVPSAEDLRLIAYAAELASLVIERKQADAELERHRRQLEEQVAELRHLSERLQLATHGAGIGIWDWDVVRNHLVWDDAMYRLYGIRKEDFGGAYAAWEKSLAPADFAQATAKIRAALRGEQEFSAEFSIIWPDGSIRYLKGVAQTFRDAAGQPLRMVGINYDITARKTAEDGLRRLNEGLEARVAERTAQLDGARKEAEAANRAKGAFLAAMSHEIRTPMNAVLNMVGVVLDSPITPEQREYLKVADSSARHLLSVINDILDFSKIESGKLDIEDIPFSLHGLLEGVCDLFRSKVAELKVELVLDIAPETPDGVRGDPLRLRQVLVNLVGNAFKFTLKGQIVLSASADDGKLRFTVADSGIGISPEHQRRLFQPFMQADAATTRRFGGTGLGLTISRRLVQLMGGNVTMTSVMGEGSVFTVEIQSHPDPAGDRGELRLPLSLQGRKVLLIEDNAATREAVRRTLERHGLVCVTFPAVEPALEWLTSPEADDLVAAFVDWLLPECGMDGLAGIVELRRLRTALPHFLVSAFADRAVQERAKVVGAAAFIPKPVTWAAIHSALQAALAPKEEVLPATALPGYEPFAGTLALLAEDHPQNQLVAKVLLKKLGISVEVAENGRIALEMATANPDRYGVILMDMQMPEMDGLEATREIRAAGEQIPALKTIPIVAMTANAMKGDLDTCLEAGMNGYVTKPIDKAVLAGELRKVLRGSAKS